MDNAKYVKELFATFFSSNGFDKYFEKDVVIGLIYDYKDVNVSKANYFLFYDVNENVNVMDIGSYNVYSEAVVSVDMRSSVQNDYYRMKDIWFRFLKWTNKNIDSMTFALWKVIGVKGGSSNELSDKMRKMYRFVDNVTLMKIKLEVDYYYSLIYVEGFGG